MKTSIYQLHIPRTSGVFIRNALRLYSEQNNKSLLSGHNFKIEIEDFSKHDYITGHYGLTPIPYASKTFTIMREPAERTFSYMKYVWQALYKYLSMDEAFTHFLTNKEFRKTISNQQSNFLTSNIDLDVYNRNTNNVQGHVLSGWSLITGEIKSESVIESISSNNIDVLFFEDKDLYKNVFNIFELDNFQNIDFANKLNKSIELDIECYKKYYDEILKINDIDIEVYNILRNESK